MKSFKMSSTLQLVAVKRQTISPKEYLELSQNRPSEIKRATYVSPRIGKPGFGSFDVEYRTPKLVPAE